MASMQKRLRDIIAAVKRNPKLVGGAAVGGAAVGGAGVAGLTIMDEINDAFTVDLGGYDGYGDKTFNFLPIIIIIILFIIGFVIFKKLK